MRSLLLPVLAAAALALLAVPAQAQMDFSESHQVRIAYGDIPSTEPTEAAGQWNFVETLALNTSSGPLTWVVPTGHTFVEIDCDCPFAVDESGAPVYRIAFPDEAPARDVEVRFMHTAKGDLSTFATTILLGDDSRVFLYTAEGTDVQAPVAPANTLPSASVPGVMVRDYEAEGPFWFSVAPASTGPGTETPPAPFVTTGGLLIGTLAGMAIWSLLVKQGVVQKKTRKQVAAVAAHKEVAKVESKETLSARKRVLMAGLKELEVAKMNKDVELEVYDELKSDLKKQTVTVMRALEEAS